MRVSNESFAFHMQHRPRRVAFLVDLGRPEVDEILRSILRFNLDCWGGRHNPIVPLVNGAVPESFYPLLDVADPDVFYVYGELELANLAVIHSRYSPTFVDQHRTRIPLDEHSFGVGLREQASIRKYLRNLRSRVPLHFGRQEPCVLQLEIVEGRKLSPFFLWNFGHTDSSFFAIQNDGIPGCRPNSVTDGDLLELLWRQMNLAWPIHACGDAPLARTAGDSWRHYIPVFYGDSPWNVVAYWNDGLTTGPSTPLHGGITQLWLTRGQVETRSTYEQLVRLLQRRAYAGNHQRGVRMISYDTPEAELESVGKRIVQDVRGMLYYEGRVKFDPPQVAPVEPRVVGSFFRPPRHQQIEYATGREIHLRLQHPLEIEENTDQCWMVDVRIDNPGQELWYSNAEPWWRLPRKAAIAGIFNRSIPQRVISNNCVSFEVDGRHATLDFVIPSSGMLFRYLLSPQINYHLAADLRTKLDPPRHYDLRLSDKGLYLSGILELSHELRNSLYLFEHPFWRNLLEKLSRREPSRQLKEKLTSDVKELLNDCWAMNKESLESWLTEKLVLVSKQLSKVAPWLTFGELNNLYESYLGTLPDEERRHTRSNLRSDLSELTRDRFMFQGVELPCPNCISSFWYSVEELGKAISCRGCHVSFPLPAETVWSYQLNELVRAGISDHGLSPVLRTLARLFDGANDCFFFRPPTDFLVYPDEGEPRIVHELDLAWVKDGLLGIAEVKTLTKSFKTSDFEGMRLLAEIIRPDIVLIAAPDGAEEKLLKGKKVIEEKLTVGCKVWAWGPEEFKEPPSWVR